MVLLVRTTPKIRSPSAPTGLSVLLVDMRDALGKGLTIRPISNDDQPRDDRGVLRRSAACLQKPDRGRGQGLSLHPLRDERGADPDRAECVGEPSGFWPGLGLCQGARCSAGRSAESGHPVSARSRLCELRRCGAYGGEAVPSTKRERTAAPRRTWPRCWPPTPRRGGQRLHSRPSVDSASPPEYDIERKFRETRLYQVAPIRPTLSSRIWPNTSSRCPAHIEPKEMRP